MKWFIVLTYLFLSACSSLPKPMRNMPYTNIGFNEVNTNASSYQGMPFRWGGTVINVISKEKSSQVQILFYPLSRDGRPRITRGAKGRFAITKADFLDPAIFKEGTEITVTGILSGEITQKIGKKTLTIPLLKADYIHIWHKLQNYDDRFYPYGSYYPYFHYYRHNYYYNGF